MAFRYAFWLIHRPPLACLSGPDARLVQSWGKWTEVTLIDRAKSNWPITENNLKVRDRKMWPTCGLLHTEPILVKDFSLWILLLHDKIIDYTRECCSLGLLLFFILPQTHKLAHTHSRLLGYCLGFRIFCFSVNAPNPSACVHVLLTDPLEGQREPTNLFFLSDAFGLQFDIWWLCTVLLATKPPFSRGWVWMAEAKLISSF